MKNKILIIIPAYNEEKNILKTYQNIINYNKKHHTSYQGLVINDGSKDGTEEVLQNNNIPHITLIHNLGIGGAVQTGYKYALENDFDIAIQFDGDGQHDINCVKNIIEPILKQNYDLVIGSRFIKRDTDNFQSSALRRIGIKLISKVIQFKTGNKIYDTTSGFRAANKKVIELFANNYPVEYPEPISTVTVMNQNYKVLEVPVKMNERNEGTSSITSWKTAYYMVNVVLSIIIMSRGKRK